MPRDTDEEARRAQVAAIRRLSGAERMRIAAEMSEDARRISIERELSRHPHLTVSEAREIVLRRAWGREVAARIPPRFARATLP